MPSALITGVTGQTGSYLAELLLEKGYIVYGMMPHRHSHNLENIAGILDFDTDRFVQVPGDMTDPASLVRTVQIAKPDEVYNLAAQSFVKRSWDLPSLTLDVNTVGLIHLLEACRQYASQDVRIYQASSSEIFGKAPAPQCENTPWDPQSPYAISKAASHMLARNYRDSYDMHISCGFLFNHESERRGEDFVTQKVCKHAVEIKLGLRDELVIGDLTPKRDWGYAPDYAEAMWRMLQQPNPDEYVIGTGESHSVQELVNEVFSCLELPLDRVRQSEEFMRPCDVPELRADASKAKNVLGWEPSVCFEELVRRMVVRWLQTLSCSGEEVTATEQINGPTTTNDA